MKIASTLVSVVLLISFTSSAFAGGSAKQLEKAVRAKLTETNGNLRRDMLTKLNDYDVRHAPEAATAKAQDLDIGLIPIGSGHYRHLGEVTRYVVTVKFEILRPQERFPVAYTFAAEIQENQETGAVEYVLADEGQVL